MAAEQKTEEVVPVKEKSVEIDETIRRKGRVISYHNRKGFGFIGVQNENEAKIAEESEETEEIKIFVHWKAISSSDRWPKLTEATEVEFFMGKQSDGRQFAANVTAVGGGELNEDEVTEVVPESPLQGKVKFYDPRKGFGFVELQQEAELDGETLAEGTDVHVGRENILSDDPCPSLRSGMIVKFSIAQTGKGISCVNVVNENGEKISVPPEQRRKRNYNRGGRRNNKNRTYHTQILLPQIGVLEKWNEDKGFGWIRPNEDLSSHGIDLSEHDGQIYVHRNDVNGKVKEGCTVCFSVFFNRNRGVTATQVLQVDANQPYTENYYGNYVPSSLSLLVDEHHVSKIIGKKGQTIREINEMTSAVLQVHEVEEFYGRQRIVNIMGYSTGIKNACLQVLEKIYGDKRDEKATIVFLIHDVLSITGRLIGKNGNNINTLRRIPELTVTVTDSLPISRQAMTSLRMEGGYESVEQGINMAVDMLVKLYFETVF